MATIFSCAQTMKGLNPYDLFAEGFAARNSMLMTLFTICVKHANLKR